MPPAAARPPVPPSEAPDLDACSPAPFSALPPDPILRALIGMRGLALRLINALVPPQLRLFELSIGQAQTQLLAAAARHRIADLLADGPLRAEAIARLPMMMLMPYRAHRAHHERSVEQLHSRAVAPGARCGGCHHAWHVHCRRAVHIIEAVRFNGSARL